MRNNKILIIFCLIFLYSCGSKKVSYRDNSPKKIKNKQPIVLVGFFKTMTNEQRTHWYVNTYSKTARNC